MFIRVLGTAYNEQVFLNIKLSEQAHMDAVKRMLDKYQYSRSIGN